MRDPRTRSHRVLACLAAASICVLGTPAFAQPGSAGTDGDSIPSGQSPRPADNTAPNATQTGGDGDGPDEHTKPPSQRLPKPKSSDYGATNYNAPGDAKLDRFAAKHQPDGQHQEQRSSSSHPSDNANSESASPAHGDSGDATAQSGPGAAQQNID